MEKLIASSKFALGAALLGLVASASAEPVFGVDANIFGYNATFQSDKISGTASTLLTPDAGTNTIAGKGYISFGLFQIPGTSSSYSALDTGLTGNPSGNAGYLLWTEYSYTTKLVSGALGQAGSTYNIISMTLTFWGEAANGAANNSVFTQANVGNAGSGTVAHSGDTKQLGYSTFLAPGFENATINGAGGTSFSPTLGFELTADGKNFFVSPNPFYEIAFGSFTNVVTGVSRGNGLIAVNSADGGVTFNRVPEPASIALIGVAVLGAGVASRRRKSVK